MSFRMPALRCSRRLTGRCLFRLHVYPDISGWCERASLRGSSHHSRPRIFPALRTRVLICFDWSNFLLPRGILASCYLILLPCTACTLQPSAFCFPPVRPSFAGHVPISQCMRSRYIGGNPRVDIASRSDSSRKFSLPGQ